MHTDLKDLIDFFIKRNKKGWDNLIVIDGLEGAGKSTLGKSIGYYYAYKHCDERYTLKNVFFEIERIIEYATSTRKKVIMWDEAAFGGLSNQWHEKTQKKLIQLMMVTRKYGHFYIFIIPSFWELKKYLAIRRSILLLNVYSPDLITRGQFCGYNIPQKTWLYNNNRKTESYGRIQSVIGDWTLKNTEKIYDENEYEEKKDAAILKHLHEDEEIKKDQLNILKKKIATRLPLKTAMEVTDACQKTIYNWKKLKVSNNSSKLE